MIKFSLQLLFIVLPVSLPGVFTIAFTIHIVAFLQMREQATHSTAH